MCDTFFFFLPRQTFVHDVCFLVCSNSCVFVCVYKCWSYSGMLKDVLGSFCAFVGFGIGALIPQGVGFGNGSSVQKLDLDPLTKDFCLASLC